MQIRFTIDRKGNLELTAATFSLTEFDSLRIVLLKAGIGDVFRRVPFKKIGIDREGRNVRVYSVGRRFIPRLEQRLGGSFDPSGLFMIASAVGHNYACREIVVGGRGKGCEDIVAPDDSTALVKCALIAGRNRWFGGEANAGSCPVGAD